MIARNTFLLICALSVASGSPTGMVKRTKSGVPLFLVTDFQIIERYTDDTGSPEEFSGNASSLESVDRTKREAEDKTPPQSLLDYMTNTLSHRVVYPEQFEQIKKVKLTNRLQKSYKDDDFIDNNLRVLRSTNHQSPAETAIFPHEEEFVQVSVMQQWMDHA